MSSKLQEPLSTNVLFAFWPAHQPRGCTLAAMWTPSLNSTPRTQPQNSATICDGFISPFLGSFSLDRAFLHLDHVNILAGDLMGDIHPVCHTSITTLELTKRVEAYFLLGLDLDPFQLP